LIVRIHCTRRRDGDLMASSLRIEVVYAQPQRQRVVVLDLPMDSTAREAAMRSGLDSWFTDVNLAQAPLGIFGERVDDDHRLVDGDRVELYRPLQIDPMDARRRRAAAAR